MDTRARRLGWGWWALALLLLAGGVYVGHGYVRSAAEAREEQERRMEEARQELQAFRAKFATIRVGMTKAQVETVLGPPWPDRANSYWAWFVGLTVFQVNFDWRTERVTGKKETPPTFK